MHKALKLLRKIPKGKVVSYKELARVCKSSPRGIGSVMRHNKNPKKYPCYKVVCSNGSVGGYSVDKGMNKLAKPKGSGIYQCASYMHINKKIGLLKKDGIKIRNGKIHKKYFYRF